jgi:phosphonate transport system ATP-binding protein
LDRLAFNVQHLTKTFSRGAQALQDVSFQIERGEMVALIGASGSGKSTLIRALAGLTPVDLATHTGAGHARSSAIDILGLPMQRNGRISSSARALRTKVGIIFQQFNLVPRLSVLTNVTLGALGRMGTWRAALGLFPREERARAMVALARVGIAEQALKRGNQLSGGQQQRAAIARTLVQGADVVIADEPIASLDPSAARRVMDILADLNAREGITILVSLHQVEYALRYCPRTIALRAGKIVYDGPSNALTPDFLRTLYGAESEELFLPGLKDATLAPRQLTATPPVRPDFDQIPLFVPHAQAASQHI